jgi:DNA invertase Pin-like site-specific DNA recombinase
VSAVSFVAYLRVSTERQGQSGLGIEAQRRAVAEHVNGHGKLLAEYVEVESGGRSDRPQLAAAMAHAKATGAKLVVAKLDRLARNVAFLSALMASGVDFVAADMPMANKLTVHILAAVAEAEREAISARTKAAMAVVRDTIAKEGAWTSRRSGKVIARLGNPNGARALNGNRHHGGAAAAAARIRHANEHAARVQPMIEAIRGEGITTYLGIARELTVRGVLTAQGGSWDATRVRRLLARSG